MLRPFLLSTLAATALVISLPGVATAQQPPRPPQEPDPTEPGNLRSLTQQGSMLSLPGGERLMSEAAAAISSQNYAVAATKLQDARQVYNQLSNFYQELAGSFAGIDNRISEELRQKALQSAQSRDQATYQLALVHRAQNRPELAVPLLVQIIRSQQPTRELGNQAYQQLLELGFVDASYQRPQAQQQAQPIQGLPSSQDLRRQQQQQQRQPQPQQAPAPAPAPRPQTP